MGIVAKALRVSNASPVPLAPRYPNGLIGFFGRSSADPEKALGAMQANGTLFAIVDSLADSTASADWCLYAPGSSPDGEPREITSHAALDLWNKPNPFYTSHSLVETCQQHYELVGERALVVLRAGANRNGIPLEIWPVRPDRLKPVPHPEEFISGFVYTGPAGEKIPLQTHEVIWDRRPNPLDPYRGMGAVQAILVDLDSARYSAEWNRNFFLNSAEPGGIIEVEHDLTDSEFRKLVSRWGEQHKGVAAAHRVGVLEAGQKWVERKYSMRDMQFSELRGVSREIIREAFRFPKPMLGTVEDVNRANAEAAEVVYKRWLIRTRLERWKRNVLTPLLAMFPSAGSYYFDYELEIPDDEAAEAATLAQNVESALKLIDAGVEPAEAFAACDLPAMNMVAKDPDSARRLSAVEALQKLYLATEGGVVITPPEARAMINELGGNLNLPGPFPKEAEPAPDPGGAVPPEGDGAATGEDGNDPGSPFALFRNIRPDFDANAALWHFTNKPKLSEEDTPDLSQLQADWEAGLASLLERFGKVKAAWFDVLAGQVRRAISDGDLDQLASLSVPESAIGKGAALLAEAMVDLAHSAAAHVVSEAEAQGVKVEPVVPDEAELTDTAKVLAALVAAGYAISAGSEGLRHNGSDRTPAQVERAVLDHLESLTDAQPAESFGGGMTGAANRARIATMKNGPVGAVYASEQLDKNTCKPCRSINGRWLGNTDDLDTIEKTYPGGAFGGYIDCQGRSRCRGTVVGVWRKGEGE